MIQKNEFPILEYDFDSTEILKPNHGAEQLTLPEKCVFAFLGDTIDAYAAETARQLQSILRRSQRPTRFML